MQRGKVTPELEALTESQPANDWVDIVVEFQPPNALDVTEQGKSRSEKIEMQKEAFRQSLRPVEDLVKRVGGDITGRAWINRSVRLRFPASRLSELSELETVAKVDVPRQLNLDNS